MYGMGWMEPPAVEPYPTQWAGTYLPLPTTSYHSATVYRYILRTNRTGLPLTGSLNNVQSAL